VLALRQSLGADESPLPAELANIEAATLPAVAADAVLQTLANPANSKACLDVLLKGPANRTSHAHDLTSQTELLQQAIVVLLQQAAAIDVAVALSLVNVPGGLAALVRSISATNTAVTPITKVAILQLLTTLSQHSDLAAEQLVEHCKVVPILVQQLAEVKVVKGKPAAPVGEALAAARSTASIVTPASDEDSKSRQAAAFPRHKMLQRQQQPGKVEDLSAGAKQPAPAPHAIRHATAGKVGAACVTAVLQLLQALAGRYWVGVGCWTSLTCGEGTESVAACSGLLSADRLLMLQAVVLRALQQHNAELHKGALLHTHEACDSFILRLLITAGPAGCRWSDACTGCADAGCH